jgi:hypothetical protein
MALTMEPQASELRDFELRDFGGFHIRTPPTPKPLISEHFHVNFGDVITSRHLGVMKLLKVLPFVPL